MIDLKYLRENLDAVKQNIENRFTQADADLVVTLYEQRNNLITEIDELRKNRNENAKKMKGNLSPDERSRLIEEGKQLKTEITRLEDQLKLKEEELYREASRIPNMAHPDAPVGKEEKDNLEIRKAGTIPQFAVKPKDHVELVEHHDLVDFDTATKVSGTKFYYLKNEAVFLELGLVRFALDLLAQKGFTLTITPDIAKEEIVEGIGFHPRGAESNIYTIEEEGTCLVGTAEITLGGYFSGRMLDRETLPIKLAGFSHCFRREAGAAGKYSKGLYRVHQFSKVEMFIFCEPSVSEKMHNFLLEIEEEIYAKLGIPYRVVDTCTGDLGNPAYRKFDLEAWMPGRGENGEWGEITSTSNCTDYQSRRLNIRYKDENGKKQFVHMLNGTAIAVSRALIALLENFHQSDGSIVIPEALIPYTGFSSIGRD